MVAGRSVCRRDGLVRLSAANNWLLRCAGARRRLSSGSDHGEDDGQRARAAESPPLYRESDHRFDAPAKPVGRQQIPHFASPTLGNFLGFEDMILLRTGGLAASPPVRYTLETAELRLVVDSPSGGNVAVLRCCTGDRCLVRAFLAHAVSTPAAGFSYAEESLHAQSASASGATFLNSA